MFLSKVKNCKDIIITSSDNIVPVEKLIQDRDLFNNRNNYEVKSSFKVLNKSQSLKVIQKFNNMQRNPLDII